MKERTADRIGWGASLCVHIMLALIFAFITLKIKPFNLEFTQISFSSAGGIGTPAAESATFNGATPLVELPRRPMLDETSPLLKLPETVRRPDAAISPERMELKIQNPQVRERTALAPFRSGFSERAPIEPVVIGSEAGATEPNDLLGQNLAGDQSFGISWEGTPREKISGDLPRFPPGVNRSATVKISFTVSPDGAVILTLPLSKGLPEFEKAAIEALRNWRFNALDRSQVQANQKGAATFIFQLK